MDSALNFAIANEEAFEDYLILRVKKGDQVNPSDKNAGAKEGFVVDYQNMATHNLLYDSNHARTVFSYLKVPLSAKGLIDAMLLDVSEGGSRVKKSKGFRLDLKKLAKEKDKEEKDREGGNQNQDLYADWTSENPVDPTDCTITQLAKYLEDVSELDYETEPEILDTNSISSGSWSVGPDVSDDYPSIATYAADFTTQTAQIDGTYTGSTTETGSAVFSHNNAGFDYTLISDDPHLGNINAGYTTSINHTSSGIQPIHSATSGFFVCDGFKIKNLLTRSSATYLINASGSNRSIKATNMHLDGGGLGGSGINMSRESESANVKIYDCNDTGFYTAGNFTTTSNFVIYNCGTGVNCSTASSSTLKNFIVFSCTTNYTNISNITGLNNQSDHATNGQDSDWLAGSSGNVAGRVAADEIVTDTAEDNFGQYLDSGNMGSAGVVPSHVTLDISGVTYASPYPAGCYENGFSSTSTSPYYYYLQQEQ